MIYLVFWCQKLSIFNVLLQIEFLNMKLIFSTRCTARDFSSFHSSLIALNVPAIAADLHLTFTTEKCWTFFFLPPFLHLLTLLFSHQSHAIHSMKQLRKTDSKKIIWSCNQSKHTKKTRETLFTFKPHSAELLSFWRDFFTENSKFQFWFLIRVLRHLAAICTYIEENF